MHRMPTTLFYLHGQQSLCLEVWEQFETEAPDAVVIPVGQGGLLIGAWLGFRRLMRGRTDKENADAICSAAQTLLHPYMLPGPPTWRKFLRYPQAASASRRACHYHTCARQTHFAGAARKQRGSADRN